MVLAREFRCMRRLVRAGLFLTLLMPLGCSKGYRLAPVSGRVTMDNRPLANAQVSFYPTGSSKGAPYASGRTDEQGNYRLEAVGGGGPSSGAVVGENRVSISLNKRDRGKKLRPNELRGPLDLVPAKYNTDTTLTCTVPPEGKQDANFALTSR
jgi:hypothetical protein